MSVCKKEGESLYGERLSHTTLNNRRNQKVFFLSDILYFFILKLLACFNTSESVGTNRMDEGAAL